MKRLSLLLAICLSPLPARAQAIYSLGMGRGSGWPSCDGCSQGPHRSGWTGYLRAGGFLRPHFALSAEASRWQNTEPGAYEQFQSLLAVGQLYPQPGGPLSFKLGLGLGGSIIRISNGGGEFTATGFGYTVGANYDVEIRPHLAITVFGDFLGTSGAAAYYTLGSASGNLDGNVLRFGLGVTHR